MDYNNQNDNDLLLAFQSGEARAFEVIYNRYWQLLYLHARNMLRNDEEAKDVVQEVFTVLWSKLGDGNINPPLAAFLYSVTRNKILNMLKHLKIEAKYLVHIKDVMDSQTSELTDSLVVERDLARQIEEGIESMPPKMREIFKLSRREYKSHKEISEQLNISDKTVKRQVSNALNILKGKLYNFCFFL